MITERLFKSIYRGKQGLNKGIPTGIPKLDKVTFGLQRKYHYTIGGDQGAGKSTIAKLVAKEFNLMYINTGAMYRAVALKAAENNLNPENVEEICRLIKDMKMKFENDYIRIIIEKKAVMFISI